MTGYLANLLGVEPTRAAIAALPEKQVYEAAAALTNEVQTAPYPAKWGELVLSLPPFMPTVAGDVLKAPPLEAISGGQGTDVAVMIGSNLEEIAAVHGCAGGYRAHRRTGHRIGPGRGRATRLGRYSLDLSPQVSSRFAVTIPQ